MVEFSGLKEMKNEILHAWQDPEGLSRKVLDMWG